MKLEPLEFNALQVGLDNLIEGLQDVEYWGSEPLHKDDADYLKSAQSAKTKLDNLQKAIESEGGFSSVEIFINE